MKLVYRRIMFWTSVVIFFTLGPALIFYAQGYRIIPEERELVNTGTLVVSSRPVNADIILNNSPLDVSTPYTIDSLTAGEHLVELVRDGYMPWSKRLEIKEGQSTFASDVRLIQEGASTSIEPVDYIFYDPLSRRGFLALKQSEDGLEAVLHRSQLLGNFIQPQRNILIPVSETNKVNVLAWQASDDRLILSTDDRFWLLDFSITDQPAKELTAVVPTNFKTLHWSTRNPDELLLVNSNIITLVNLAAVTKKDIPNKSSSAEVFSDSFTVGNLIMAILSTDESARLVSLNAVGDIVPVADLTGSHHSYVSHNSNTLITITRDNELQVYHVNGDSYRPGYSVGNITETLFNSADNELLFTNGKELYTYNINKDRLNLLVRQAKSIKKIDWFEDSHISYLSDGGVYLIERDGRNGHVMWELAKDSSLSQYYINNAFDRLFYVAREEGKKHLFEKEI